MAGGLNTENTALHFACQIPSLCLINELSKVTDLNPLVFNRQLKLPMDMVPQNYLTSRKRIMELSMRCLRDYFKNKTFASPIPTRVVKSRVTLSKQEAIKNFSFVTRRRGEEEHSALDTLASGRKVELSEGRPAQKILSLSIKSSNLKIQIPPKKIETSHGSLSKATLDDLKRKTVRSMNLIVRMPKQVCFKNQRSKVDVFLLDVNF